MRKRLAFRPPHRTLALFGGVILAVGLLAAALFATPEPSTAAQLEDARARWEARPFSRFRMVSRAGDCQQIAEFTRERFLYVKRQNCFDTVRSVERLFRLIEGASTWGLDGPRCAPSGCACAEKRRVYAIYHERYGYPIAIRLRKHRWIDWSYVFERPETLAQLPECIDPPDIDLMRVTELTPLDED